MHSSTPTSLQDLLIGLSQKQTPNPLSQLNPFSQLLQMNLQFNLLKTLAQNFSPNLSQPSPQAQLLNALGSLGSVGPALNSSNEASLNRLKSLYMSSVVRPDAGSQLALMDSENSSTKKGRCNQSLGKMGRFPVSASDNRLVSPATIPAFNSLPDSALAEAQEISENEIGGLSAKSKKIKKMNVCGHPERAHYAKNMCNQCYHKHGRTKKPWRCNHEKLYAHGLCQNCYINAYNKKRNQKEKETAKGSESSVSHAELETDLPNSIEGAEEPLTMEDKVAFADVPKLEELEAVKEN